MAGFHLSFQCHSTTAPSTTTTNSSTDQTTERIMNLLIFGPTGGTGRQLMEQALAQGHHVTAFVRSPEKITTATG